MANEMGVVERLKDAKRDIQIKSEGHITTISVDGVIALVATERGSSFFLKMIPDMHTFADWHGIEEPRSVKYNLNAENHLTVSCETQPTTLESILAVIEEELIELNTYGYTTED